jgi:hypothetical protein
MSNFMRILLLRAELFHREGWRTMAKLIVALRNFANAPKNSPDLRYIYVL